MIPRLGPRLEGFSATLLALALLVACTGCYTFSFALPPALTEKERAEVEATRFRAKVAVLPLREAPMEAVALLESLRHTQLFEEVGFLGSIDDPDLVARVRGTAQFSRPSAVAVGWTLVSLGVIPTITADQWATVFSLHPAYPGMAHFEAALAAQKAGQPAPVQASAGGAEDGGAEDGGAPEVAVDFRVDGDMHVGLVAMFTGLFSSRSFSTPPMTERYGQALALRLARRAPEIEAMIESSRRAELRENGDAADKASASADAGPPDVFSSTLRRLSSG